MPARLALAAALALMSTPSLADPMRMCTTDLGCERVALDRYGCIGICAAIRHIDLTGYANGLGLTPDGARLSCWEGNALACAVAEIDCGNGDHTSCAALR